MTLLHYVVTLQKLATLSTNNGAEQQLQNYTIYKTNNLN